MDTELIYSLLAFSVTAAAVAGLTFPWWFGDSRVDDRLNGLAGSSGQDRRVSVNVPTSRAAQLIQRALPKMAVRLLPDDQKKRSQLHARLMQAGIYAPQALAAFQISKPLLAGLPTVAAIVACYFGYVSLRGALVCTAVSCALGIGLPGFWLDCRRRRRHAALSRSLPDAIDLMVACVEGGLSLDGAIQRVTDELKIAHPVLAGEMSVVTKQMEFGSSADVAIQDFADRTGLDAIQTLSALVQQARRYGTGIAEALRSHAEMIRTKRELIAEELAQKAAVKIMFPTLLFIFPSIFVVLAGPAAIQLHETFAKKDAPTASRK